MRENSGESKDAISDKTKPLLLQEGKMCHHNNHRSKEGAGRLQEKCHLAPADTSFGGARTPLAMQPPRSGTNDCAKGWKNHPCQMGAGYGDVPLLGELAVVDQA